MESNSVECSLVNNLVRMVQAKIRLFARLARLTTDEQHSCVNLLTLL